MSSRWITSVIAIGLILLGSSCKREDGELQPENLKGKVVLPEGSGMDVNSLSVLSPSDESAVDRGKYNVEIVGDYTAQYVTNTDGDVVMMGYRYPGKEDDDITSSSTVLGLIMMTQSACQLTEEGKLSLVNNVLNDANFGTVKDLVELNLMQNRSLFDTSNTALATSVETLFESAKFKSTGTTGEFPVLMNRAGRNFNFTNGGKSYSTVIGVYQGGARIHKMVVDGIEILPTSITDLVTGGGDTNEDPPAQDYTLNGDGNFLFKLRTGRPGADDGSSEHDEALRENAREFALGLINTFLPLLEVTDCYNAIVATLQEKINFLIDLQNNPSLPNLLESIANQVFGDIETLVEGCGKVKKNWFFSVIKHWNWVSTAYGVITTGANTFYFGTQWGLAEPAVDTCFSAVGTTVTPGGCGACDGATVFTDPRDGEVYTIISLGDHCWMGENLRYNAPGSWYNSASPDPKYGRLYDWNTVMDGSPSSNANPSGVQGICPDGWHVPSDAEWTELELAVGMDPGQSAITGWRGTHGPAMSSVSGWGTGGTPGDNASGFNAYPAGYRNPTGSYGNLSMSWEYWTTTETSATNAMLRWHQLYNTGVLRSDTYEKTNSFSCRCVKD